MTTIADLEALFVSGDQRPLMDYEIGDTETLAAGEIVQFGTGLVGISPSDVPRSTALDGAQRRNALALNGIWSLRKADAAAFSVGDQVRWDDTANEAVDASGDFLVGTCVQDVAGTAGLRVLVWLNKLIDTTAA